MKLLLIRFSSLGDIILNSSVPKELKARWGSRTEIHLLTADSFAPLVRGMEGIDKVHSLSRQRGLFSLKSLYQEVKKIIEEHQIDAIIDLHGTLRGLLIRCFFYHLPRIAVDKRTIERGLLTLFKIDLLSWQFKRAFQLRIGAFGGKGSRQGEWLLQRNIKDFAPFFDFSQLDSERPWSSCSVSALDKRELEALTEKFQLPKNNLVAIVPSASFVEKRWPIERFYSLLEKLLSASDWGDYSFLILAGKEDSFCTAFNPLQLQFEGRLFNLQGKTNLLESAALLKLSKLCIGNDTGLPHIAESVGTPAVFILGPTGEEFGFYPHLKHSELASLPLWCRPCTTNGKGRCIRSERFCLTGISVEKVYQLALKVRKNCVDKEVSH